MASSVITLTSPVGKFEFRKGVILSRAKLIRDSITGQVLNPIPGTRKVVCEDTAYKFAAELDRDLANIPFVVSFA